MGKLIIKSNFCLLPCYLGDFDLFKFEDYHRNQSETNDLDHYFDDFFFAGKACTSDWQTLMDNFNQVCDGISVPVSIDKTEGPATTISHLRHTINSLLLQIPISMENVVQHNLRTVAILRRIF